MAAFTWPSTLPHPVDAAILDGYDEPVTVRAIETEMDLGPPKEAYIGLGDEVVSVAYMMTETQRDALVAFARDTIKGVARFETQHPRTGAAVEVTFVRNAGRLFTDRLIAHQLWLVAMQLRVWP
jgi:hypothetical protein